MKITALGTGTCAYTIPRDKSTLRRKPPAFLVQWGDEQLLFDCSAQVNERLSMVGVDYATISRIAISHTHPDHCALVHFLQSVFCEGIWGGPKNNRIEVFGP